MIIVTSKYVLGIIAACVVGYLVLLLPVLPKMSALSVVQLWWTWDSWTTVVPSFMSRQNPREEESASSSTIVPEKRKRTLLEQKFAIDGPEVVWDRSTITLEYQMAEWVTNDVLDYEFYDWECQNQLDVSVPTGWKVIVPQKIDLFQAEVDDTTKKDGEDKNGQISEGGGDDEEMKMNNWRLELQQQQQRNVGDEEEGESDTKVVLSSSSIATSFCIRFKLYNMPKRRQNSMEVTFRQTQLSIEMDSQEEEGHSIQSVKVSKPEPVAVHVKVNGRGRAKVHRNPDNKDTNDDGASENQKKDENNVKTDRNNAEESRQGMGEASSASSPTTTSTPDKDEL